MIKPGTGKGRRLLTLSLLAIILPLLLAACGGDNQSGGGGTIRWSNEGVSEIDTLDPPATNASNSVMAVSLIFEGLVRLDAKLNIQPAGAESWDISPDGKTYTFHIRKDLKWADGSAVTAEDF